MHVLRSHVTAPRTPHLLSFHDATVVRGGKPVLDGLTLRIAEGEHTAILGPNGSGKSSLIKLLNRTYYPLHRTANGTPPPVSILGRERWNVADLRAQLGIVSADAHSAFVHDTGLTGLEAVLTGFFGSFGIFPHNEVTPVMREAAAAALALMEILHLSDRSLAEMSTGEARRVLIARALVHDPRALLLDEPTTGLDLLAARRFLDTLRRIMLDGKTVILVTHHVSEIVPEIARVVLLREGRVFRDGPKEDVLTPDSLSALYDTPVRVRAESGFYTADVA